MINMRTACVLSMEYVLRKISCRTLSKRYHVVHSPAGINLLIAPERCCSLRLGGGAGLGDTCWRFGRKANTRPMHPRQALTAAQPKTLIVLLILRLAVYATEAVDALPAVNGWRFIQYLQDPQAQLGVPHEALHWPIVMSGDSSQALLLRAWPDECRSKPNRPQPGLRP